MISNYFLEIKNRLLFSLICWLTTFYINYIYKEILFFIIVKPTIVSLKTYNHYFISTNITEIFSTYINLNIFITNQITFFFSFFHLLNFLIPSLFNFEYKNIKIIFYFFILFYILLIFLFYYFVFPLSWKFFFNFQQTLIVKQLNLYFEAKLSEYLMFFFTVYKLIYYINQCFIFVFLYLNTLKNPVFFFKKYKKIIYLLIFVIASLITPPDVISQLIIGLIFILFYESISFILIIKNIFFKLLR